MTANRFTRCCEWAYSHSQLEVLNGHDDRSSWLSSKLGEAQFCSVRAQRRRYHLFVGRFRPEVDLLIVWGSAICLSVQLILSRT